MSFSAQGLHARSFKTWRTVSALIMREMATTYGRSPGGYIWAILEPVGGLAIMTIAFSVMLRSPALGTSFPLFYATGLLPFMMYSDVALKLGQSIRFSRQLLFYPAVTYADAIVARFLLNTLTHLMVFYIIMTGLMWFYDTRNILDYAAILNALGMAMVVGLGVGTLNCFLLTRFGLWERIWAIVNRPMFLMSGIFFLYDNLPEPFRSYLWLNPLIHVTGEMRRGFYASYDATYVSHTYVYGFGLTALCIGFIFLSRYHRVLLNNR
ncbi:ABC transporter permease [Palleronia caenipelagi]|uniref:Transport permease protein n=1 Tax=Palleronia caenipelagi TaxID=2489174 RepID=A0A547PMT8_9RHOB|nr:ABC transporter permease [Palleronia caenipelagi]TRD15446.1 sugar ABC transporter permease [Palleronia caenipelagi]